MRLIKKKIIASILALKYNRHIVISMNYLIILLNAENLNRWFYKAKKITTGSPKWLKTVKNS